MDMVGTIVPSLIAPEVVSVQALDNRVGMINILEYQYGSDKGSAQAGQTFASPLGYQGMNPYYTTASVDGEALDANNPYLAYTPVKPNTLRVIKPDGTVDTTVTVKDAFTGELDGTITAGSVAYYLYDNETIPVTAPQIKLNIKSLPIETKSRKLTAICAFDAKLVA